MKAFDQIQKYYAIVGIFPSDESILTFNNRIRLGFLLFGFTLGCQSFVLLGANGFMEYLEGFSALFTTMILFVCFAANVFQQALLFKCIHDMERLMVTRCKNPKSRRFFSRVNRQVEQTSDIVFTVVAKIATQLVVLPKVIVSFVVYLFFGLENDSFDLPYPMWFPFDWKNPIGYLFAAIVEYTITGYQLITVASMLGLLIGVFWFAVSTIKEIKHILRSLNGLAKKKGRQSAELLVFFSEMIDTDAAIKDVVHSVSAIFQSILVSLFSWSLFSISGTMLIVQVELLNHGHFLNLFQNAITNGTFGLVVVLICCEIGQRLTDAFDKINIAIDHLDWYLFPIEMERMLPIIIANAQQPVSLQCFGGITCTRDCFKSIIHTAFSYFMVLCQLGE